MAFTLGAMGSAKTNFYNDAYCRAGYEDVAKEVQSLWVAGNRDEAIRQVPDELITMSNFIGTQSMVEERLDAFKAAGVNTAHFHRGVNLEGKDCRLEKPWTQSTKQQLKNHSSYETIVQTNFLVAFHSCDCLLSSSLDHSAYFRYF